MGINVKKVKLTEKDIELLTKYDYLEIVEWNGTSVSTFGYDYLKKVLSKVYKLEQQNQQSQEI